MVTQMVQVAKLISDLDGAEADGTIHFGLDDKRYELDVTHQQEAELRDLLTPYIGVARELHVETQKILQIRTVPRQLPYMPEPSQPGNYAHLRRWAQQQGYKVPRGGRIKDEIVQAYIAAGYPEPEAYRRRQNGQAIASSGSRRISSR